MKTSIAFISCALLAGACTVRDTRPEDNSVAGHEAAAAAHDAEAKQLEGKYNPNATDEHTRCGGARRNLPERPCWTTTVNPTAEFKHRAGELKKMADEHRAAAQALRDAESAACAGVSDEDRDLSPFEHREDIVGASELGAKRGVAGATITIKAVPGLTEDYLEKVVACHLARNASMGFAMPEMAFCPLDVKGATATVTAVDDGFRVDVKADDPGAAAEISRRAQALVAR